jgi:hypothetical protein
LKTASLALYLVEFLVERRIIDASAAEQAD